MKGLYLVSVSESSGKTILALGIAAHLRLDGRKAGYIKPFDFFEKTGKTGAKADVSLFRTLPGSSEFVTAEPLITSPEDLLKALGTDPEKLAKDVKQKVTGLSPDGYLLAEGLGRFTVDVSFTKANLLLAESLDLPVAVVLKYPDDLDESRISGIKGKLASRLAGVLINMVPRGRLKEVQDEAKTLLKKEGIRLLGIVPEERFVLGFSLTELKNHLGAGVAVDSGNMDEIVENLMLGAVSSDLASTYFERKSRKAAILRGDRVDMQIAALHTDTVCLILCGSIKPNSQVMGLALSKQVPVLLVKESVDKVVSSLEGLFNKTRLEGPKKTSRIAQTVKNNLDFSFLLTGQGLN